MAKMKWDQIGDKIVEAGVDKGVLWLPHLSYVGIPWNGLISVADKTPEYKTQQLYFEGNRYMGAQRLGAFSGTIQAVTYPDDFEEVFKTLDIFDGLTADNQAAKPFNMSYRTLLGNDKSGFDHGYKIHLLYNLIAIPQNYTSETIAESSSPTLFSWDVNSTPVDLSELEFSQTAHAVIDSRYSPPDWLTMVEETLYGTDTTPSTIPTLEDLINSALYFDKMVIIDNGDGTWTAIGPDDRINMISSIEFELLEMNSVVLTTDSFLVSSDNVI